MIILNTKRLAIRKLNLMDAGFIFELLNSPGWLQFIGDRNIKTFQDAENYLINGPINSYNTNGYGLWLVTLIESKTPIGICGIIKRDNLEFPDIGYAFMGEFMGNGYAVEAAKATLHHAQNTLKLENILGITKTNHIKSKNVLEKIGMKYEKDIEFNSETLAMYKIGL
jgi:[ribosomal protein S5]-alanine N-acetyltransferase